MDVRTRTSLFCGALALAIAASILLRARTRRASLVFAAFAADTGLWYLAQWRYHLALQEQEPGLVHSELWARFTAVLAVILPQLAIHLLDAVVPHEGKRSRLPRFGLLLAVPMLVLVFSPVHRHGWVRGAVFTYVFGLIAVGLWALAQRGRTSRSRAVQQRVRFLVLIGALAAAFSLADFLWFIGAPLPPVGAVLAIVFLFVLAEAITRERLLDVYELLGQLVVSTALAFTLAGIFYAFVVLVGGFGTMYLSAVLAAIVILVLFEPLRSKVEQYIHKAFFLERFDLDRAVGQARRVLVHTLRIDDMAHVVIMALEASRRATAAALYLRDPHGYDFELCQSFGREAPRRIDGATARPLIERLSTSASVDLERVAASIAEWRRGGAAPEAQADERLLSASELLGDYRGGVCVALRGEDLALLGILVVVDERVRDAFSPDDVALLESLTVQMGVVVENSRQHQRMQERDRLAALGQMAAGLAHEIKNPLGAIKGAAQLLAEPHDGATLDPGTREFLGIILEEVERLDRVVGSVLDYARPSQGDPGSLDVNAVVKRTAQVLQSSREDATRFELELDSELPPVRADAEQLRQVLINLVRNAVQAMNGRGLVRIATRLRVRPGASVASASEASRGAERRSPAESGEPPARVEIAVHDAGPGIAPQALEKLFVPFFTTKSRGTGLGLAISQRIVQQMGGRIEVASEPGAGSTFTISLPAALPAPAPAPDPGRAAPASPAGPESTAPSSAA